METINGAVNYQGYPSVVVLGNFDGLHLAHREIIERAKEKAFNNNLKVVVFLLNPHPVKVLSPHKNFLMLSTLEDKEEMLEKLGVDYMVVEPFTLEFAEISPLQFVQQYLVQCLNVKQVVVGFDYTFGSKGTGTPTDLLKWGEEFDFNTEIVPPVIINNEIASSSLIRELLSKGKVYEASQYLGYYFRRKGKVIHGEGRGKTLGYPTANLHFPEDLLLPANGVYLTLITWKGNSFFGLTNIGSKPTFSRKFERHVEVYIIEFKGDIYEEELTVMFLQKIRNEVAFSAPYFLVKQIESDLKTAVKLIKNEYGDLLSRRYYNHHFTL